MFRRYGYVSAVERALGDAETVLDVGCGNNSPLGRFERRRRFSVGVDLFEPFLEESRQKRIHDEYRLMNVLEIGEAFDSGSFDAVVACDLLEHLEPDEGSRLLRMMEEIARRRVVVLTPNGFLPQGETWGNPLQRHRSGWTTSQMRELGYTVFGLNGLRVLRGERGVIRWRPHRAWDAVAELSRPLVYSHPDWAFHILCVKELSAE